MNDVEKLRQERTQNMHDVYDNKIPQRERNLWPIVLNADNEIILVPKIGPNVTHYSNTLNMFVVK